MGICFYKKLFFLLAFFILVLSTSAQERVIKGNVFDQITNKVLADVHILVKGTDLGTVSNKDGYFELKVRVDDSIIISHAGYETVEYPAIDDKTFSYDFFLTPKMYELEDFVITATRTQKKQENVPILTRTISDSALSVISSKTIENVLETHIPDISFSRAGYGRRMTMQGLDSKYTLFLIDGERFAGELNGNIDYSRISVNEIERVEVLKGASSSLYGSNAIGGVINIITKEAKEPFELTLSSHYSKYNDLSNTANIGMNLGKLKSKSIVSYNLMDGFDITPETANERTVDEFYNYNISQKLSYQVNDKLKIKAKGSYYTLERFDVDPIPLHQKYYDLNYLLKTDLRLSSRVRLETVWYSDLYETYNVKELLNDDEERTYANQLSNAKVISHFNWNKSLLSTGVEYINDDLSTERIIEEKKSANDVVFFGQYDYSFNSRLNTIVGARINNHSVYGIHATPQISALYKIGKLTFRGQYSSGYRAPSLKELYMDFSPVPIIHLIGNEELTPEVSNYYAVSCVYKRDKVNFSLALYHNSLDNMITEVNDTANINSWIYKNIDEAKIWGTDMSVNVILPHDFCLDGSYNYNDIKDSRTETQVWGTFKHSGVLRLSHQWQQKKYIVHSGIQMKVKDKTVYDDVLDNGEQVRKHIPSHVLWKFDVSVKLAGGMQIYGGVDNVLDFKETGHFIGMNPGRRGFVGVKIDIHELKF